MKKFDTWRSLVYSKGSKKPKDCSKLTRVMADLGISNLELADAFCEQRGYTQSCLEKYRANKRIPSDKQLIEIAQKLSELKLKKEIEATTLSTVLDFYQVNPQTFREKLNWSELTLNSLLPQNNFSLERIEEITNTILEISGAIIVSPDQLSPDFDRYQRGLKKFHHITDSPEQDQRMKRCINNIKITYAQFTSSAKPIDICRVIMNFNFYDELDYFAYLLIAMFWMLSDLNKNRVLKYAKDQKISYSQQKHNASILYKIEKIKQQKNSEIEDFLNRHTKNPPSDLPEVTKYQRDILQKLFMKQICNSYTGEDMVEFEMLNELEEKMEVMFLEWDNITWELIEIYELHASDDLRISKLQRNILKKAEALAIEEGCLQPIN